jgi:hypothetical protein
MRAEELRIGNLIKGHYDDKSDIVKVIGYDPWENFIWAEGSLNPEFYEEFSPIPLIEEWLVKFGFKFSEPFQWWYHDKFEFTIDEGGESKFECSCHPITTVHQLQNLYFTLTGQELTIK